MSEEQNFLILISRPYIVQSQRYGDRNEASCPDCRILSIFSGQKPDLVTLYAAGSYFI